MVSRRRDAAEAEADRHEPRSPSSPRKARRRIGGALRRPRDGGGGGDGPDDGDEGGGARNRPADPAAPTGSITGTGSVTEGDVVLDASKLATGFAFVAPNPGSNGIKLILFFTTQPNACGRLRSNIHEKGERYPTTGLASNAGAQIEPGIYQGQTLQLAGREDSCSSSVQGTRTVARGTLEIVTIDDAHVVGKYSGARPGGDASASSFDFDLPRDCTRSGNAPCCEP